MLMLRVVCRPKRWFGTEVFGRRFVCGFVFPTVVVGVGAEELRNEPFLVAVEVADIW